LIKINTIRIILVTLTLVSFSIDRLYVYGQEGKTLDIIVNLNNVSNNIGTYEVHVTAYGKELLEESKVIDDSANHICPDDIESLCYVKAGTFSFPSESVPVGSKIQACVKKPISGIENCALGKNTQKKTPETIWVGVPVLK
jgi:hypothetical protein